jgi:regulator of sigma E protease
VNNQDINGWYDALGKMKEGQVNTIYVQRHAQKLELKINDFKLEEWANQEKLRPEIPALIGEVIPKSPAYLADIRVDDEILQVNGEWAHNWYEMTDLIALSGDEVEITLLREGQELTKTLTKMEVPDSDRKMIGVVQNIPVQSTEKLSFFQAIETGFANTVSLVAMNYVGIYNLIKKPSSIKGSIGGPVTIFTTGKQYAEKGIAKSLQFVGLLNIVLMVMNLLPIPVLDGGHILFSTIEGIRGKRLSQKSQIVLQQLGFFFLISLMMYAFYSDFAGIISRYNS